ncbi:protein kinase family protein [Bacillus tianshenii]|nr:protein kinase family protein [Bacillus tianshenii]
MSYEQLYKSISFKKSLFKTYKIFSYSNQLEYVGKGRSAAVFRISGTNKVMKAFYPEYEVLASIEAENYRKVCDHKLFPRCYHHEEGYLILDYIEGTTLFDCLEKGVTIQPSVVKKIDRTFQSLSAIGVIPIDLHLKNIILTVDGEPKIIDIVRYGNAAVDHRWTDFKRYYERLYHLRFIPKKYPSWFLSFLGTLYKNFIEKKADSI